MGVTLAVRRDEIAGRDRIDVERLVYWAYAVQRADRGGDFGGPGSGGSMWLAAERQAVLGCRVDGGGTGGAVCHDDAFTVDQVVETLPGAAFLLRYSARGLRPDWHPDGVGRFVPVRDGRGGVKYDRDRNGRAVASQVRFEGALPEVVAMARAEWLDWWGVLDALVVRLWGKLSAYEVTGPAVAREPWKSTGTVVVGSH